ncbi:MAG TPA: GNAT family N-acetyltransferase [Acidobacteriaceae bacterium]|nr:GNAT family N-acetyltransferase [Acidobacteriaceae bacterium]
MKFRNATAADIPQICALERLPQFRTLVGSWPEEEHLRTLANPDAAYLVVESLQGQVEAFAILRGLQSEHRAIELKRIVVGTPDGGIGKELLAEVAERAFGALGAHRLFLDVFVSNGRARYVYESFGFQKEGIMREAVYRDGQWHSLILMSLLENEYRAKREGDRSGSREILHRGRICG